MYQYTIIFTSILDGNTWYFNFYSRKLMSDEDKNNFRNILLSCVDTTKVTISKIQQANVFNVEKQEVNRVYFSFTSKNEQGKDYINSRMMIPHIHFDNVIELTEIEEKLQEKLKSAFEVACIDVERLTLKVSKFF